VVISIDHYAMRGANSRSNRWMSRALRIRCNCPTTSLKLGSVVRRRSIQRVGIFAGAFCVCGAVITARFISSSVFVGVRRTKSSWKVRVAFVMNRRPIACARICWIRRFAAASVAHASASMCSLFIDRINLQPLRSRNSAEPARCA
jgi:hypothetical protein